jgi:hypothetical protein
MAWRLLIGRGVTDPETGGTTTMAVDQVLLHIVIALGIIAVAARTTGSR